MDVRTVVTMTNQVSKKGDRMTVGALLRAVHDNWDVGVPILLGHDAHVPLGWSAPFGLHMEPGCSRVVSSFGVLEDEDDKKAYENRYNNFMRSKTWERVGKFKEGLKEAVNEFLTGDETFLDMGAATFVADGLAERVFPDIFDERDKYGLVEFGKLESVLPGVYEMDGLLFYAHHFMRRNVSRLNSLNADLLAKLEELAEDGHDVRVRLDPDAVGLAKSVVRHEEWEYWRGPHFDDDLTAIDPGVTRHRAVDEERHYHGIDFTDFWWKSTRNKEKGHREHILEIEELLDRETLGQTDDDYACRYAHSIVDEETKVIEHLDGSIRGYRAEKYLDRIDVDISKAGKRTNYTKLWRIDGNVALTDWKALIYHHFRNNPLVGEYLAGEVDKRREEEGDFEAESRDPIEKYVPHMMTPGDGVRVMLTFHESPDEIPDGGAIVVPVERITRGQDSWWVVDSMFVHIEKLLRRDGCPVEYSRDFERLALPDAYHEFPPVVHADTAAIQKTLSALKTLLEVWKEHDRTVVFRVGLDTGDFEARVSLMGPVPDLLNWIDDGDVFPASGELEDLVEWAEGTSKRLELQDIAGGRPPITQTAKQCGLAFVRVPVDDCIPEYDEDLDAVTYDWRIPNSRDLTDLVTAGRVGPAMACVMTESKCTKCGNDYSSCDCTWLVDDSQEHVEGCDVVGVFYSDKTPVEMVSQASTDSSD